MLYPLFDKRMSQEVAGDSLGEEFKGYVFRIGGGNDKQGFPMKQGVLCNHRVRLLFKKGMSCYRERRKGMRKRKSVRGCIVGPDLAVVHLVMTKKGEADIPGLTDDQKPRRLGPKRASKIRKLFGLEKKDDVRQFVVRRVIKEGKKTKAPKIQRLITPQLLQRKRYFKALVRRRMEAGKAAKAEYQKRLAEYNHEKKEAKAAELQKKKAKKAPSLVSAYVPADVMARADVLDVFVCVNTGNYTSIGDVKKEKTLQPGHQGWAVKTAYLEAKSKKRHLAYLKIEAVEEKKAYPEHDDFQVILVLGDPQCSPVWTAAVQQLEIGEKARFALSRKALDFNPENLAPDDSCSSWEIELIRVQEVEDVAEDFQQLLEIETSGGKERAEDLDNVAVHWRVRRWMPEGTFCIASSRERLAIMPGYGLVPIEDQNAPPVQIAVGEGQQEAVELIASKIGPGGKGHLFLKSQAMKMNRPNGCVIMDVEVVAMDANRGPGTPGADPECSCEWSGLTPRRFAKHDTRLPSCAKLPNESLTQTQRAFGEEGTAAEYETETAVSEYLHFHYGRQSSVLAAAFGGKDIGALDAFGRVVAGCLAAKGRTNALDVGCATGGLSFDLSEHFDHVVGIDASMAFIRAASCLQSDGSLRYNSPGSGHVALARAKGRPSRCSFACADAADFMQQGLRFDLILACNVLCRLRRPRQWLASLPTSLSPQGVVVLVTPFAWLEAFTPRAEWLGNCGVESSRALSEIMQRLGFQELRREEVPFVLAQNERIHELFVSELTVWQLV
ncbi:unnamed protein product [Effrenium voratum]|nr:unnamed protein product [Effrenium voratum]